MEKQLRRFEQVVIARRSDLCRDDFRGRRPLKDAQVLETKSSCGTPDFSAVLECVQVLQLLFANVFHR